MPRPSRIFLHLGYVLLTVTLVNFAVTTHDVGAVADLTGDTAILGLERFGRPLLDALLAITLAGDRGSKESLVSDSAAQPETRDLRIA